MSKTKKQTAVEWLFEQVVNLDWKNLQGEMKIEIFEQAKKIEKEQIKDAFMDSRILSVINNISNAKQYYNETYNND